MGCNCHKTIKTNKDAIRERAIKFAVAMEVDVQIHSWTQRGVGRLWDFEEKGSVERGKGVIEIIKFRNHKSKNVLSHTEGDVGSPEDAGESTKSKPGKSKRKSGKDTTKVAKGDKSTEKGESK